MDPRGLLKGNWTCRRTRTQRPSGSSYDQFLVIAKEMTTGDRVVGHISIGDNNDCSRADLCLPSSLADDHLWHLGRIEPRHELASGGTKALVRYLTELADTEGAWLLTFVQPLDETRAPILCALLSTHGGFQSPDEEFPFMMTRAPVQPTPG